MTVPTVSYSQWTDGAAAPVTSLDNDSVPITGSDTYIIVKTMVPSLGRVSTVTLDPGGAALDIPEHIPKSGSWGEKTLSGGGGYHTIWSRNISNDNLDGVYTVRVTLSATDEVDFYTVVINDAVIEDDAESWNNNGPLTASYLTSSGENRFLLTSLQQREDRSVTLAGDLDTNIQPLVTSSALVAGRYRADTASGSFASGYATASYDNYTSGGHIMRSFLFKPTTPYPYISWVI